MLALATHDIMGSQSLTLKVAQKLKLNQHTYVIKMYSYLAK